MIAILTTLFAWLFVITIIAIIAWGIMIILRIIIAGLMYINAKRENNMGIKRHTWLWVIGSLIFPLITLVIWLIRKKSDMCMFGQPCVDDAFK